MKVVTKATIIVAVISSIQSISIADVSIHKVINSLSYIESNHTYNAIGDSGKAIGILQIHKCVIDDVNRIRKTTNFKYSHRKSPAYSRLIARIYLHHYTKSFKRNFHRAPSASELAMMWNGGGQYYRNLKNKPSKTANLKKYVTKFNKHYYTH